MVYGLPETDTFKSRGSLNRRKIGLNHPGRRKAHGPRGQRFEYSGPPRKDRRSSPDRLKLVHGIHSATTVSVMTRVASIIKGEVALSLAYYFNNGGEVSLYRQHNTPEPTTKTLHKPPSHHNQHKRTAGTIFKTAATVVESRFPRMPKIESVFCTSRRNRIHHLRDKVLRRRGLTAILGSLTPPLNAVRET